MSPPRAGAIEQDRSRWCSMDDVTLRDVLLILTGQIDEVKENQEKLRQGQQELVEATNHKIDKLKRQGIIALVAILAVGAPVVADHWHLLFERARNFF